MSKGLELLHTHQIYHFSHVVEYCFLVPFFHALVITSVIDFEMPLKESYPDNTTAAFLGDASCCVLVSMNPHDGVT